MQDSARRVVQEGSQAEVASLVASGAGVAIVPVSLRAIRRVGVLYRPLHERPMTRLDLVWLKDAAVPVRDTFLAQVQQTGPRRARPKAGSAVPAGLIRRVRGATDEGRLRLRAHTSVDHLRQPRPEETTAPGQRDGETGVTRLPGPAGCLPVTGQ
jgi:hypothetical protein